MRKMMGIGCCMPFCTDAGILNSVRVRLVRRRERTVGPIATNERNGMRVSLCVSFCARTVTNENEKRGGDTVSRFVPVSRKGRPQVEQSEILRIWHSGAFGLTCQPDLRQTHLLLPNFRSIPPFICSCSFYSSLLSAETNNDNDEANISCDRLGRRHV